ncbi:MAG TPA: hypothetical protein VIV11_29755 [Kofleriaceae bacterium]
MRTAIIIAIAISSSLAAAQPPGMTPEPNRAAQPHVTLAKPARPAKHRVTAHALSAIGSLAPLAVFAASPNHLQPPAGVLLSAMLLPSAGHWYTHRPITIGMGIRVVGIGLAGMLYNQRPYGGDVSGPVVLAVVSFAIGATVDMGTAGSAVDRWNAKHATVIAPMPVGTGYGVGIAGQL